MEQCIANTIFNYMSEEYIEQLANMDWALYKLYNADLAHMDQEQLTIHYKKFGRFEERRASHDLPEDFVVDNYREMNDDLAELSDEELKKHYTVSGKHERRPHKMTDSPDRRIYIKTANDVKVSGITYINK